MQNKFWVLVNMNDTELKKTSLTNLKQTKWILSSMIKYLFHFISIIITGKYQ